MIQGCPCYNSINPHLLWPSFSTPSSSLISFSKFETSCCQAWFFCQTKFFIVQPFGICIAVLLKYGRKRDCPKSNYCSVYTKQQWLQVPYLCFVFKIHLWKHGFQIPCINFQSPKCKLWGLPVSKYWILESAFPKGLLERIRVLFTLRGSFVLAFLDISTSLGSLHILSPRLAVLQISLLSDKIWVFTAPLRDVGVVSKSKLENPKLLFINFTPWNYVGSLVPSSKVP